MVKDKLTAHLGGIATRGKTLYLSPLAKSIQIHGGQVICQSNLENALPNMGWGGNYNTEPLD